ncbi:MAG: glycosyltransferase family 9 protein [Candidatus Komeilibacteria bacterium]|nr:glycosyltransferase family 9 protein [Candidatus Komeilibacteria bacterium]
MRTSKSVPWRYALNYRIQYLLSKLGVLWFHLFGRRKISFVSYYGIGDCIMGTGVVAAWKKKYPHCDITVITKHPEIYSGNKNVSTIERKFRFRNWPVAWLMYEHNDLVGDNKTVHIRQIMASMVGINKTEDNNLFVEKSEMPFFYEEHLQDKRYAVIQPAGGGWDRRRDWAEEKWSELIKRLESENYIVYIIGDQKGDLGGGIDRRGRQSLTESMLMIKYATCFLGVNSFGEQAAAAFGVPSLIIYGPTHPGYSLNKGQLAIFGEDQIVSFEAASQLDYDHSSTDQVTVEGVYRCLKDRLGL